jgi:hypothetical protein
MECPFIYNTEKLYPNAKYILINGWYSSESDKIHDDDHRWCIGVYNNFYEALGHAYNHLSMIIDSWTDGSLKRDLPMFTPLEDDAGWMMTIQMLQIHLMSIMIFLF